MNSQMIIKLCAFLGLAIFVSADVSHIASNNLPVTDICLGCICEASSGCDRSLRCSGDVCGLFRITWAYWSDAGKPTQEGELASNPDAYANCVNEPYCAASTIQGYMKKFGKDCNNDGEVNCLDYAKIHKFGGYGCSGELPAEYKRKFDACIQYAIQQQTQG